MTTEKPAGTEIHPAIAAMEKADEQAVIIRGYVGTGGDGVLRLYLSMGTSEYVEIPRDAVIHVEEERGGEQGAVRAFVRSSSSILNVRRYRVRVDDWVRDLGRLPPVQPRPTFWTCAGQCEGTFVDLAIRIHVDEARALTEANPEVQAVLLAQIAQRKHEAKAALLTCLSTCVDTYGAPPFMAVPDDSVPGGFRLERFSLGAYHGILVARHLEKPE